MPAYSINHIQHYWGIFMHIETLLRHIQAYSGILSTLPSLHIHNLAIFWAVAYLEPEAYLKPCKTLTKYIQNPAIGHYSAIFRHIQNLVQCLHTQKPGILGILEYSGRFRKFTPTHNPVILTKIYKYSELWPI